MPALLSPPACASCWLAAVGWTRAMAAPANLPLVANTRMTGGVLTQEAGKCAHSQGSVQWPLAMEEPALSFHSLRTFLLATQLMPQAMQRLAGRSQHQRCRSCCQAAASPCLTKKKGFRSVESSIAAERFDPQSCRDFLPLEGRVAEARAVTVSQWLRPGELSLADHQLHPQPGKRLHPKLRPWEHNLPPRPLDRERARWPDR